MKTLFVQTLFYFVAALLIFLLVMSGFLAIGFGRSLDTWRDSKYEEIIDGAAKILTERSDEALAALPQDIALFVYDASMTLQFSNRGGGWRKLSEGGTPDPIVVDGRTVGYYHIGNINFQNDLANQQFLNTMLSTLWMGLIVSGITSVLFALIFSRSLSNPARAVALGIDRIAQGSLSEEIPEAGAEELAQIARASNNLRNQLSRERQLRAQWAQDIAHDLRTPISALKAQFEAMRDGALPLDRERVGRNIGESERMNGMINDLEELMKLENPELRLYPGSIDAAGFISQFN